MSTSKNKTAGIRNNATGRLARSAYTYYGGVVQTTNDAPKSAHGIKRLFAAALLSGASMMAVGLAGAGTAQAGNCVGPINDQIVCSGTFDETIQYHGVEDLTVILGAGSSIDTLDNVSEADFDNAGIFISGDGKKSIVNNGSILTGDEGYLVEEVGPYFGGNRHHGIAAYSYDDDASVANTAFGTIVTTRPDSHGAVAVALDEEGEEGGDATASNAGLVATSGETSFGVVAVAKYEASVHNSGDVTTSGDDSHGLYAYAKYDIVIANSGTVETSGEDAHGIVAVLNDEWAEGGTVEIDNSGTIETTGEHARGISVEGGDAAVEIVNSGSIATEGYDAHGIVADGDSVAVVNTIDGTIVTDDEFSDGVRIDGYTVSLDNAGTIATYGEYAHAVVASSHGDLTTTIVNTGLIAAYGEESDAIRADGPTVHITNDVVTEDEEIVATGVIYSEDGAAIYVSESDDARVYNHGEIYGNISISADEYALVENSGSISGYREYSAMVSLSVEEGNAVVVNREDGTITSLADYSHAIQAMSEEGIADVRNYGQISTGYVDEFDEVTGVYSSGAVAYGFDGAVVVNAGGIETVGEGSYGILAEASDGTAQAVNSGTIETSGDEAHGVVARTSDGYIYIGYDLEPIYEYVQGEAIASNAGSVTTSGSDAFGVVARSGYGNALAYNVLGGSIVTSGEGSHGLAAVTGWDIDDIGEYGTEAGGDAIAINGFPGEFFGEGFEFGIGEYAEGHVNIADFVDTEDFEAADFRSTIVTTGDDAIGVLANAQSGDARAANFYGTVTTGTLDEYSDPLSGSEAHGVAAYASGEDGDAYAINKYYGHVTTYGHEAIGVLADSENGEAIAANVMSSTVQTFGEYSHGVAAFSEEGDAIASNKYSSSIVTHGDEAHGLFASSNGESDEYGSADGIAYNIGSTITTYGEGSHGIHAYAEEGDAIAVNANIVNEGEEGEEDEIIVARIETHGDGAHGIFVYSHSYDVHAYNSGEIATYGEDAVGIRAEADDDADVENAGSIDTSGDYAYGIHIDAGGDATVTNSGSIVTTGYEADGILAYAGGEYGEVEIVNSGLIHGAGEASDAIRAFGHAVTVTNTVDGQILSDDNDGIEIDESDIVRVYNSGTISGAESAIEIDESGDVAVYNYGSIVGRVDIEEAESAYFLNDEDATVLVENEKAAGVRLLAFEEATVVNRGSIETTADGTRGVQLQGSTVSLDNSGTISTSGDEAHAVVAESTNIATTTIYNSGTIEATGEGADAVQASGPTVYITNTEDGVISSGDGVAIDVFDTKYASILNHGTVTGDIHVSAYDFEDFGSTYILNTGSVSGDIDTSFGESDDTIIVDGGTVGGAIHTGEGDDTVTISGTGVSIAKGIHGGSGYESDLHVYFEQEDTVTFDDGVEGYAISNAHFVGFYGGTTVFDGVNIHTRDEGTILVGEDGILATTAEGAYAIAVETTIDGRLHVAAGGSFGFSGAVAFNAGSTFQTGLTGLGGGVVAGDTVHFDADATIHVNAGAGFTQTVGEDVLVASAGDENGVTDDGASVTDNLILFKFLKVMNDEIVTEGAADDLFLRIEVEDTAFDVETEATGSTRNKLSMARALDVYIQSQPLDNPLVQYLLQFETEEEQLAALLKVIQDTLPDESNATGSATITTTDLVFDMIMDRLSGGGFSVAQGGETGVAAGEEILGGSGNWALWGRMGYLTAKYTPGAVNGFDADTWGGTVGIDGEVAPGIRAGFGYFYMDSEVEENGAGANSSVDITSHGVTGYVSYRPGAWYANGTLGYGINDYDSRRNSLGGVNVASFDGSQFVARGEVGRMFTDGAWDITPNVGLRYNRVDIDAYTETGPLPIAVNARTVESVRGVAGVNLRHTTVLDGGGKLIPEFGVKLLNELADPDEAITGAIVGGGAFVTQQTPRDDLSFGIGGGLTWEASDRFSLRVTYDGEFQSDYDEQSLAASVRFGF